MDVTARCEHKWVYSDAIYCTLPTKQDRICSVCGEEECVIIEDPFEGESTFLDFGPQEAFP